MLQVATEFTTASVTSPGIDLIAEKAPPLPGNANQQLLDLAEIGLQISNNQSLHYGNIRQRGKSHGTCRSCLGGTQWKGPSGTVPSECAVTR